MKHDDSHGMGKHMILMAICCLVPLGLIALVGIFGLSLGPWQGLLPYAIILMCPVMMIFMMRGMTHGGGEDHSQHHPVDAPQQQPTQQLPTTTSASVKTVAAATQDKCH